MDNLAHTLVGLAVAKAGLERASPYATTVCVLAANAPDADVLAALKGRWFYLENHRGITHSVVGVLTLALVIPFVFYLAEKLVARLRGSPTRIRLRGLVLASLAASATHPLLDWTNSYGVRPFLPWSGKWYYGDLVFIIDPWLWLVLGGACALATARTRTRAWLWAALAALLTLAVLFARADVPVPARALWLAGVALFFAAHRLRLFARFGRLVPALALAFVPAYWCALAYAHTRALQDARSRAASLAARRGESVRRVAAMPSLANPALWRVVSETDAAGYVFQLNLTDDGSTAVSDAPAEADANSPEQPSGARRFEKLRGADAERVAQLAHEDERARVFLAFARFPLARVVEGQDAAASQDATATPPDATATTRGAPATTQDPRATPPARRAQLFDLRFADPGTDPRRATFAVEIPLPPQR